MSVPNKGEARRVTTDEWFTEYTRNEADTELRNRYEISGHVRTAACATPVPLGPCRQFLFISDFLLF